MKLISLFVIVTVVSIPTLFFIKYSNERKDTRLDTNRFSLVSHEYVNGEAFRVYVDKNTKIEYLQTSTGMVMLKEKL